MSESPLLLVVDDDPSVLLLVDVLAEKMGFRVKAVSAACRRSNISATASSRTSSCSTS